MSDTVSDDQHAWILANLGFDPRAVNSTDGGASPTPAAPTTGVGDADGGITIPEVTVVGRPPPATLGDDDAEASDDADGSDDDRSAAMGGGGRGGGPPADELDEGEGRNRDGTVRRKPGDHGRSRGSDAKSDQDAVVDEAVQDYGLTEDEREELHQEIGGRNLGRKTIREIAEEIRNRRKPEKKSDSEEADPDNADEKNQEEQAEEHRREVEKSDKPLESDDSILVKVGALVAALGLSILLIPTIAAAVVDPEPVTKLALAGLTVAEIGAIAAAFGFVFSSPSSGDTPGA